MEGEELIFGYNGIVSMSNVSSLAEKQKYWLHGTLILTVNFEIKSLDATKLSFSSSMTNSSNLAGSWWELKVNSAWPDSDILWVRVHKKFYGSTGLLELDFTFMLRVSEFRSGDKDHDSDGTLFQGDGKTLNTCRMAFV